jgi:hypothetical protein
MHLTKVKGHAIVIVYCILKQACAVHMSKVWEVHFVLWGFKEITNVVAHAAGSRNSQAGRIFVPPEIPGAEFLSKYGRWKCIFSASILFFRIRPPVFMTWNSMYQIDTAGAISIRSQPMRPPEPKDLELCVRLMMHLLDNASPSDPPLLYGGLTLGWDRLGRDCRGRRLGMLDVFNVPC